MTEPIFWEVAYFPGCSLATSSRESNQSLVRACEFMGLKLVELEDWNCCGSSSAHSLDPRLGLGLAARNLIRAPRNKPLMTMCPSCFRNLLSTQIHLKEHADLRQAAERKWGGELDSNLHVVTFLEILHFLERLRQMGAAPAMEFQKELNGLKVAPYYGCMAMFPPAMRRVHVPFDLLDRQLKSLGAEVKPWEGRNRCCGTFLTAARPDITTPLINRIMKSAIDSGAECLVTACAMCQLNLEIRCTLEKKIPIFHFSELMALVLGAKDYEGWFKRHLVDPQPLLAEKNLIA
ncbi:MAG: heterodisulfide reductase-related iron-sulfur binding cluster [Pseudomonadota bacterium]